jgi:hypothetical protein
LAATKTAVRARGWWVQEDKCWTGLDEALHGAVAWIS